MADTATIKELLEAGAHFGHQTSRWHPRMKKYIFTKRNGIHIIDLEQTAVMLAKASDFIKDIVGDGGKILFVGTKKQAQAIVQEEAKRAGMFYVNQRWIGGTLTNFAAIQSRIDYLVRLEDQQAKGELARLPKKEAQKLTEEIEQMNAQLGGIKEMTALPDAPIPSNDDAIRAIKLVTGKIASAILEAKGGMAVAVEKGDVPNPAEAAPALPPVIAQ